MALRPPKVLDRVAVVPEKNARPFPPRGFVELADHAFGEGDTYGLYWPIGLEDRDPLVVESLHDTRTLVPAFSALDRFLDIAAGRDGTQHVEWPSIDDDGDSPHALYHAARKSLKEQDFEKAISLLSGAIARLPEYTEVLGLLSRLCVQNRHGDACRFAIRAIRSPPCFGRGGELPKVWAWLSRQSSGPDDIASDPIWLRRAQLRSPPAGGTKENPTYGVLMEAAEAYALEGQVIAALALMQTYAEFMERETGSFQERHGFTYAVHRDRLLALEAHLPAGLREIDS